MTIPEHSGIFSPQAKAAIVAKINLIKNLMMESSTSKDPSELVITLQMVSDFIMDLYDEFPEVEDFLTPMDFDEQSEEPFDDLPPTEEPPSEDDDY